MASINCFFIWLLLAIGISAQVQSIQTSQTPTTSRTPDQLSSAIAALPTPTDCSQIQPGTQNVSVCWFTIGNIPSCARDCLQKATLQYIPCQTTDLACLCAHSTDLQSHSVQCLLQACSTNDVSATVNYYYGICRSGGLPLQGQAASSSATNSSTSTSSTATQPAQATQTTLPTEAAATDQGLSLGAKVGIGVGVAFGFLILLALLALLFLRRRRHQKTVSDEPSVMSPEISPRGGSRKSSGILVSTYPKDYKERPPAKHPGYSKALPKAPGTPVAEMEDLRSPGHRIGNEARSPLIELDGTRRGQ